MAEKKKITLEDVYSEVETYINKPESLDLIHRAAEFAEKQHDGQLRKSGEPYVVHLYNVAYILATLHVGPETIAAGFLHDTIEDTNVSKEELGRMFTPEIAEIVESVTKIGALTYKGKDDPEYQAANHRKLFIAMAKDVRVILVKLADRLHNMRTLQYQSEASQKRIAAETMDVYAPIAHRLGISAIKNELEDLSFFYLDRESYYRIAKLVEMKKAERDESVQAMIKDISRLLTENHLEFRIFGRSKHLYSIYHKMEVKHKRFDEILDLLAIRIITKTKQNCYEVLGYIQSEYTPIPGRLKDYIAVPKTNMYQSLHTTIIGEDEKIFEIQIRTEEMDEIAERGVAAHWRYKEGSNYDTHARQKEIEEKLSWFRDFAQFTGENAGDDASELMTTLRHDVFEANVYVMTPKGRVIDLPSGSTPIDFAYRIHTDVGHTMVGAIVNNAMVPLNTELHTGDVVQIKTQKGTGPSEDWLKIVKSNQARNKIRAYLTRKENEKKSEHVEQGEKILADELRRRGFDPDEYMDKKKIENIVKEFGVFNYVDLMYGLVVKSISPLSLVEKLTNQRRSINEIELSKLNRKEPSRRHVQSKTGLIIPGIESMKMSLAQCCLPVYGDDVKGFITKGEGVKVHRCDCANVKGNNARLIDVQWDEEDRERLYDAGLVVLAHDRSFLFTDIVTVASQSKTPIVQITANTNRETLMASIKMKIQVHNLDQLQTLMANIKKVESVVSVERRTH